jgi:hypothetical protein
MMTTMTTTTFMFLNASTRSTYFMYSHVGFFWQGVVVVVKPSFFDHDDSAWYGGRVGLITP